MRFFFFLSISISFLSCSNEKKKQSDNKEVVTASKQIFTSNFQSIIDSSGVAGAILIYDFQENTYYSNDFEWATLGRLPASTFKIANSIIALESEVVENDSTLFKWDGRKRAIKNWEQDLIFKDAFHFSCVPCYQDVARKIGEKRINEYLNKLEYGNMKVDSNNIAIFWLEGDSRINQFQQIDFLKRFHTSKLPISDSTMNIMKRLMVIEDKPEYKLSGKTGWSIRNGVNNGWFVGYIETGNHLYFFATNIIPKAQFDMKLFPIIRKEITYKAFKQMGILN